VRLRREDRLKGDPDDTPAIDRSGAVRKIVIVLVALLTVTGLLVGFQSALGLPSGLNRILSLLHLWGGVFFIVMFPLYAWDHIRHNRHWLRVAGGVTGSGVGQTLAAALLIGTGALLLLYGVEAWPTARRLHHWLTYALVASLLLHYLSPKRFRP
jgi:hypothetical protein